MLYVLKNPWVDPALDRMNITSLSIICLNMIYALVLFIKDAEQEQGIQYNKFEQDVLNKFMLILNIYTFVYPWAYQAWQAAQNYVTKRVGAEDLLSYFKLAFGLAVIGCSVFSTGTSGTIGGSTLNFFGIFMAFLMQFYVFGSGVGIAMGLISQDERVKTRTVVLSHILGEVSESGLRLYKTVAWPGSQHSWLVIGHVVHLRATSNLD
jgi:hypothetical protein